MKIVNRKGVVYSLCKTFHPKCFKTANFDGFRQEVRISESSKCVPNFLPNSEF